MFPMKNKIPAFILRLLTHSPEHAAILWLLVSLSCGFLYQNRISSRQRELEARSHLSCTWFQPPSAPPRSSRPTQPSSQSVVLDLLLVVHVEAREPPAIEESHRETQRGKDGSRHALWHCYAESLVSRNFRRLVLVCIEAEFCKVLAYASHSVFRSLLNILTCAPA